MFLKEWNLGLFSKLLSLRLIMNSCSALKWSFGLFKITYSVLYVMFFLWVFSLIYFGSFIEQYFVRFFFFPTLNCFKSYFVVWNLSSTVINFRAKKKTITWKKLIHKPPFLPRMYVACYLITLGLTQFQESDLCTFFILH